LYGFGCTDGVITIVIHRKNEDTSHKIVGREFFRLTLRVFLVVLKNIFKMLITFILTYYMFHFDKEKYTHASLERQFFGLILYGSFLINLKIYFNKFG